MDDIQGYHAHLYYKPQQLAEAKRLGHLIQETWNFSLGRFHEQAVGPHPEWSCQVFVPTEKFGDFIPWLMLHRGSIDFLIHPCTGDDLLDHTDYALWLGKSYPLKIERWREQKLSCETTF